MQVTGLLGSFVTVYALYRPIYAYPSDMTSPQKLDIGIGVKPSPFPSASDNLLLIRDVQCPTEGGPWGVCPQSSP